MRLYEHEGKQLAKSMGIPVPRGQVASSAREAGRLARDLGVPVVVKAQVLAGGQGKAGGIRFATTPAEAEAAATALLGSTIAGQKTSAVLVEERLAVDQEYYMGLTIDELERRAVFLFCPGGGIDVEQAVAESGAVYRQYLDVSRDLYPFECKELAASLGFAGRPLVRAAELIHHLYGLFRQFDMATLEINPLVVDMKQELYAADVRVDIDDDALYRQQRLFELGIPERPESGRAPTELERLAAEVDKLDHRGVAGRLIEFPGDIGLVIGGGGASLTVFDAILKYGGKPANYCEIGGNPTVLKVKELTKLIVRKPGVKKLAIITNVISNTRVDLIARGVIKGLIEAGVDPHTFPVVFRSAGSYEEDGYRLLDKYGIRWFGRACSMDEAALQVVLM